MSPPVQTSFFQVSVASGRTLDTTPGDRVEGTDVDYWFNAQKLVL